MLVPMKRLAEAAQIAKSAAEAHVVGDPAKGSTTLGPMVSEVQFNKIQSLIQSGIDEGATLVTGGAGRPDGFNRGYFVRPTVFSDVQPRMRIAREEIFGPVLSILGYQSEGEAVAIANDTVYGLAAYVQSKDIHRARNVAKQLRAGTVSINYPSFDVSAPFGGYKQSGNGREWSEWGLDAFLELKGIVGYGDPKS
jgi:aldehyde dehydrogenase (NAD+)